MPITKKRKHFQENEVPDDSYVTERITKCSLSSLCHPEDRDFRPFLSEPIEYCNKLRVLVSIVAKDHIFATLKEQAEEAARNGIPNAEPLLFEPNQNYYSRVKTMVVNDELQKRRGPLPSYEASLRLSKDEVLESIPLPKYDGKLSVTTLSAMMGYMLKQLAENLTTHVKTHAQDCVKNWLNNQLRSKLTDDQYNSKYQRRHIGTLKKKLFSAEGPPESLRTIFVAHEHYKVELESAKSSTAGLVGLFYRLRMDIDRLEDSTSRKMKLMAVVPQAKIGMSNVKIDRVAAKHMVKDIYKGTAEYDSNMSEEDHWAMLFNMDKVNKLRGQNHRFGRSILTDGIAACVRFKVVKPTSEKAVKNSVQAAKRIKAPPRAITGPGLYMEKDRLTGNPAHLVAIDPGIKSIITAVRLDDPTRKPLKVTQGEYRDASKLNYTMKKRGTRSPDFKNWMGEVQKVLTAAPSSKSILRYSEYVKALGSVWKSSWAYHIRP